MAVCVIDLSNVGLPVVQHISKICRQAQGHDMSQGALPLLRSTMSVGSNYRVKFTHKNFFLSLETQHVEHDKITKI